MRDVRTRASRGARRSAAARRAAPYAREEPRAAASLSIKGSSGPTWVLVANLVKGTTPDDVKVRRAGVRTRADRAADV